MDTPDPSHEDILVRLTAAGQAPLRQWTHVGALLEEVEITGAWIHQARTFTEWMRLAAPRLGLKEGSLWRYLRASRIYRQMCMEFANLGLLPELASLPESVSAESLEILGKLRRAAPPELIESIVLRLVGGDVTREELRTLWEDYRPALQGRTAQGRGTEVPIADPSFPAVAQSLAEARALLALRADKHAWVGIESPDVYEVFARVRTPALSGGFTTWREIDAVILVRGKRRGPMEFHAVEITGHRHTSDAIHSWAQDVGPFVDHLWIAVDRLGEHWNSEYLSAALPAAVGVLEFGSGRVLVARPAGRRVQAGIASGELAKVLLLSAFGKS